MILKNLNKTTNNNNNNIEPLRFWSGGRGGGEVPQKGKKAKNDYSAIADIFQYILVESLRNVKLGFKNRNLLFFN